MTMKYVHIGATCPTIPATPLKSHRQCCLFFFVYLINELDYSSISVCFASAIAVYVRKCEFLRKVLKWKRKRLKVKRKKTSLNLHHSNTLSWKAVSDYCGNIEHDMLDLSDTREKRQITMHYIHFMVVWVSGVLIKMTHIVLTVRHNVLNCVYVM